MLLEIKVVKKRNLLYFNNFAQLFIIMAKVKYYYDTKTLNYQRIEKTTLDRIKNILVYLGASLFSGLVMIVVFFQFFDSPNQKILIREKSDLISQYNILKQNLDEINLVLQDMQDRDDNIYRVIFEADPIPSSIRQAGFGGVNRYKHLENMSNSDLIIKTVTFSGGGYGKHIIIDHGYGYKTLYAHLSGYNVKKLDKVKR